VSQTPPSSPAQTYEDFFVPAMFRPWADELLKRAQPQPGERILDVACGTGIVARLIARQLGDQVTISGLDFSPGMIEVARQTAVDEGAPIDWHVGTADALPFQNGSFDLVLVQHGLQFFPDRVAGAREAYRVLVPGGRLATATWTDISNNPFHVMLDQIVERHLGTPAMRTPFSLGDRDELRAVLTGGGFSNVTIDAVRRDVRFPGRKQFLDRFVDGAVAAIPAMQQLGERERSQLITGVRSDMAEPLEQFVQGEDVVFPMESHITVARKPA
jgi:ubiquinone/menaquinone biosynthesis C-methylase UbiE